jgi:spore coat polysaccharide biosynthesis protein SpsF
MMNIFIQARMSSSRFPGKMLAPIHGEPMIKLIVERLSAVLCAEKIVVLTSVETSDDPLVSYLNSIDVQYFRGDLDNVFLRFQKALKFFPCEHFVRVCGDSPIISAELVQRMMFLAIERNCDFLSNVEHRTFPKGQSIEIVRSDLFSRINAMELSENEQEHVMPFFYTKKNDYKTCFPRSIENLRHINTCVDEVADLKAIESGSVQYKFDGKLCL